MVQIGQKKEVFSRQNKKIAELSTHNRDTVHNIHENPRRKKAFLVSFEDESREKREKAQAQGKNQTLPLAWRVKTVPFSLEMIHGVDQHQDREKLARRKMELSEKPPVGNKRCDFLYIPENIPHRAIIECQHDT